MEDKVGLRYTIPKVGRVQVTLYPPAGSLYRFLEKSGEVDRLKKLKHLGGLEYAFPGSKATRQGATKDSQP